MSLEQALRARHFTALEEEHQRALRNIASDPPAALTAASSLLESLFKVYIDEEGLELPSDKSIKPLWRVVQDHLQLDPDVAADQDMKLILGALSNLVAGIGALRTHAGSAHGRGRLDPIVEERHAMLALLHRGEWRARLESNQRPLASETNALSI